MIPKRGIRLRKLVYDIMALHFIGRRKQKVFSSRNVAFVLLQLQVSSANLKITVEYF